MLSSRLLSLCIATMLFFFCFNPVKAAQPQWEKELDGLERLRLIGKYKKALQKNEKLREKMRKKDADEKFVVQSFFLTARIYADELDLQNTQASLQQCMLIAERSKDRNPAEFYQLLTQIAQIFLDLGEYPQCKEYVARAKKIESKYIEETNKLHLQTIEVALQLQSGTLKDLDKNTAELRNAINKALSKQESIVKSNKKDSKAQKKYKELQILYAEALRLEVATYQSKGDYENATASVATAISWSEMATKKSLPTGKMYLQKAALLYDQNNLKESLKTYEKAYSILKSFAGAANRNTLTALEHQILIALELKKTSAEKLLNKYDKTIFAELGGNFSYKLKTESIYAYFFRHQNQLMNVKSAIEAVNSMVTLEAAPITKIEALQSTYLLTTLLKEEQEATKQLDAVLNILQQYTDTNEYHIYKQYKLELAYQQRLQDVKVRRLMQIFDDYWVDDLSKEWKKTHKDYFQLLNQYATICQLNDRYQDAETALQTALTLVEKRYGNQSIEYAYQLEKMANVHLVTGKYKQAEDELNQAIAIIRKAEGRRSINYASLLKTQANIYITTGRYGEAEAALHRFEKIILAKDITVTPEDLEEFAYMNYLRGRYLEAEQMIEQAVQLRDFEGTKTDRSQIRPLSLQAQLALTYGNFTEAEKFADKALKIAEKSFSVQSVQYARNLSIIRQVYAEMGDYPKATRMVRQSLAILQKKLGENHLEVATHLTDLALLRYRVTGNVDSTEMLLEKAIAITKKNVGNKHPQYADEIKNLAMLYIDAGKYNKAAELIEEAAQIWDEKLYAKNVKQAELLMLYGDLLKKMGVYKDAERYYKDAKRMYEALFDKNHPKYVAALGKLAQINYIREDYKGAVKLLESSLEAYLVFIEKFFPSMSEREKTQYWALIKPDFELYRNIAFKQERDNLVETALIYDVLTKSLLFNSTMKVRNRIINSNNVEIINLYKDWMKKKELMITALSLNEQDRKAFEMEPEKIQTETEAIEKQLNEKSEDFAQLKEYQVISLKDIRKKLQKDEAAIDIIRYRHFETDFTDSVIYAAIIIPAKGNLKLSIIPNGKSLEEKYLNYYRNVIRYKETDEMSYNAFWKPIEAELGEYKKLYIATDGVYSQLNLETLADAKGNYVIDNYDITLLTTLRELTTAEMPKKVVKKSKKSPDKPFTGTAILVGNPSYYTQKQGNEIDPLPGAEKEVENIAQMLNRNNWDTRLLTASAATEEEVRKVSNPTVFHIATHGFFVENHTEQEQGGLRQSQEEENPMLRAGLLLAGGGDAYEYKKPTFFLEEGVLTAYEAMNLSLDQTELVVLSACETGLGKLQVGEGVYGLQRSLMIAGAKNIVMSLFKVPDTPTRELMTTFYQEWLKDGNKKAAFLRAKKIMRQKYEHPYYWGSFVMLGM